MSQGAIVAVTLELEAGAEPIMGSARVDDGPPRSFCGWLALTSLLNAAATGRKTAPQGGGRCQREATHLPERTVQRRTA